MAVHITVPFTEKYRTLMKQCSDDIVREYKNFYTVDNKCMVAGTFDELLNNAYFTGTEPGNGVAHDGEFCICLWTEKTFRAVVETAFADDNPMQNLVLSTQATISSKIKSNTTLKYILTQLHKVTDINS